MVSMDSPILLCVDLQNDFALEGGTCYKQRESVNVIMTRLFPWMREKGIRSFEIISDYRQPRPGDPRDCCKPGQWGYGSLLPEDLRSGAPWIKSMNSPIWTRENIGREDIEPGPPYQDTAAFGDWLENGIGDPPEEVYIFGLTADCCVLCTVQELKFRGYDPIVISQCTDVRSGNSMEKEEFLGSPPFTFWGKAISLSKLQDGY